jgi:hypothetical protein
VWLVLDVIFSFPRSKRRRGCWEAGLLTSGLIPVVRHCIQKLMADDMQIIPMAATVYVQAVEARTGKVCGIDMTPVNLQRWHPAYTAGTVLPCSPLLHLVPGHFIAFTLYL